jgi:tyrosine-protein kinase Etk/Wzc
MAADNGHSRPEIVSQQQPDADRQGGLLDLAIVLAKRKRLVLGFPSACAVVAAAASLLMPNWYRATATILPPQQGQSNAVAILGQLSVVAGGTTQALGIKNPSDVFVDMLKSRTIADQLTEKFQLVKIYDKKFIVDARRELAGNSSITAAKDGVITIDVEDRDPKRAAELANAYVDELRAMTQDLAVGEAGQRRLFFDTQLKRTKDDLINAETQLKTFNEKTGTINPESQAILTVSTAAALRAQITSREVQLSAMRTFATETNPDLLRLQKEIESLQTELSKMEHSTGVRKGGVLLSVGEAPEVSLEYLRRFRDVKYYEALFQALAKQYELARIDEAKDATLIQVLDKAVPAERKSRPRRALLVVLTTMTAAIAATLWAFIHEALERARHDPERARRLRLFYGYLTGRQR